MWLALKKIVVALLLPFAGLFSSPMPQPLPLPPPPPAAAVPAVPQPGMRIAEAAKETKESGAPTLGAIKDCLQGAGKSGECLDGIFRKFLKTHPTADALSALRRFEVADATYRLSCHPVVHAVGRETFRLAKTIPASFAACDQTCHSGCYHGAMERFLRGDAASDQEAGHISLEELKAKAAQACDPSQPTRFRFQCLHGLGHALLFFSDYRLEEALSACDALADVWSRSSCYGGLFMENVFSATPEKRDLSAEDYHYPCSKLAEQYRRDCYMMQTTRMSEVGLATPALFAECRRAGAYGYTCMQSIGRDLSNDARTQDPRLVAAKCELGPGEERRACMRGVAYALIDNTWDGQYAFPFCAAFAAAEDARRCFEMSTAYLRATFEKSRDELKADCRRHASGSELCLAAAG